MAWGDLPADLLGGVIARLPFPGDRARLCAVCQSWRSAARDLVRHQPPWIVLPDGSFCTTAGHDGSFFHHRIPGLPGDNVTCLGAAAASWLALDVTDDVYRRTPFWDNFCYATGTFAVDARPDVRHRHAYLLHNPFSGETVPLPELDAIVGHVAETFEIRKVLMRSSSPDDVIAVTTNNWNYNVIVCRPGKGSHVLPYYRIIDVAFLRDTLYGITTGEELLAFYLGEDEDGRPKVTRFQLVISNPMAGYYNKYDQWSWPQDDDGEDDDDDDEDHGYDDNDDDEAPNEEDNDGSSNNEEENQQEDDDEEYNSNGDGMVSDYDGNDDDVPMDVPYEAKDKTTTCRYLVRSLSGELLLVKHHQQVFVYDDHTYTSKVEVFKADVIAGEWVPVTANGLGEDEVLFLSRSFSKSTRARAGDKMALRAAWCIMHQVIWTMCSTRDPGLFVT